MAFEQYTSCRKAADHVDQNQYIQATIQAVLAAGIGAALIAAAAEPWCLGIAAVIGADMWLLGYCHWWLEDRLVCLDGDKSAVGMNVKSEPPSEKSGFDALDTDFSINLLLPPTAPGETRANVEASVPFGVLVAEHASTRDAGLPFTSLREPDSGNKVESTVLHAEFEGGGVADTLLGAQIGLGLATVGLIICLGVPPPWGAIIGYILAFLALLAMLFGALFGLGDEGTPEDAGLPSVETNDANGKGADVLGVFGRWVYDAGHNNEGKGWNEIHPIKKAVKLAEWDGDWPKNINDIIADWDEQVGQTGSPLTVASQDKPEHGWEVHPDIDGCDPPEEESPPAEPVP
jgi:hypothetical protein